MNVYICVFIVQHSISTGTTHCVFKHAHDGSCIDFVTVLNSFSQQVVVCV